MNNPPLVSVIIPVYNAECYLKDCIESLLKQSYQNIETIIVDDSSTDNSLNIAKKFESEKIKVLHQRNAGAAIARNTGLANASGDYIQFLDADDYLSPDKIEKQVEALKGYSNRVAVCNYISFDHDSDLDKVIKEQDQSSFIFSSDDPAQFLLNLWGGNGESYFIQTNCWLVPRAIIEKSGPWRNYRCPDDDGEFFARVLLASDGIVHVPEIMNFYRREKTKHKLSSNSSKKYVHNTLLTINLKYSYISKHSNSDLLNKAFAKQYLNFAVYHYVTHRLLSKIAWRKYEAFNIQMKPPLLGGKAVELMKNIFGWRFTISLKHRLQNYK